MKSRLLFYLLAFAAPVVHEAFVPPTTPVVLGTHQKTWSIANNPTRPNDFAQSHCSRLYMKKGFELFDLFYDDLATANSAWGWTSSLGAPAALVAGAVLVTLGETRQDLAPKRGDKKWIRVTKMLIRFLLLSSFAMEVLSIFVSTVTGTVLLSHSAVSTAKKAVGYGSPLGLLNHHHELEFLTIQIGFLQGLFHWLISVALDFIIPKENENLSSRRMNRFMASCLATLCVWILAFYNHHLTWHSSYFDMLKRYIALLIPRYFGTFRPLALVYTPLTLLSAWLGWKAFTTNPDLDDD